MNLFNLFAFVTLFFTMISSGNSIFGWLFKSDNKKDSDKSYSSQSQSKIPFELEISDSSFIAMQNKALSSLDDCHQKVISTIQGTCSELSEEDMAKLSVHLLNCQSLVEGRQTFDCTSSMSIGDCTREMDGTTWNAYHIVSNRARAVCYATRQQDFRRRTESTINNLVQASAQQLESLQEMEKGHGRLSEASRLMLEQLEQGQQQQSKMRATQYDVHASLLASLGDLRRDRVLASHHAQQVLAVTSDIKRELMAASEEIRRQDQEQKTSHGDVLQGLDTLAQRATDILDRLGEADKELASLRRESQNYFEDSIAKVHELNAFLAHLLDYIEATRTAIECRLDWVGSQLGATGNSIEVVTLLLSHGAYFLVMLLALAFFHAPKWFRFACLVAVPTNTVLDLQHNFGLSLRDLTLVLCSIYIGVYILSICVRIVRYIRCNKLPRATAKTAEKLSVHCEETEEKTSAVSPSPSQSTIKSYDFHRLTAILDKLVQEGNLSPRVRQKMRLTSVNLPPNPTNSPAAAAVSRHMQHHAASPAHAASATPKLEVEPNARVSDDGDEKNISLGTPINSVFREPLKVSAAKRKLVPWMEPEQELSKARSRSTSPSRRKTMYSTPATSPSRRKSVIMSTPGRMLCNAMTKAGQPCKKMALDGTGLCSIHQPSAEF